MINDATMAVMAPLGEDIGIIRLVRFGNDNYSARERYYDRRQKIRDTIDLRCPQPPADALACFGS